MTSVVWGAFPAWPRFGRKAARVGRLLSGRFDAAAFGAVGVQLAAVLRISVRLLGHAIEGRSLDRRLSPDRHLVWVSFTHSTGGRAAVVLDGALAVAAVARLLGTEEASAPRRLSPAERGVLGYLALRGAAAASGWRVGSVSWEPPDSSPDEACLEVDVAVGQETHVAWLVTDEATLRRLPETPMRWERIARLGEVRVEVGVNAGSVWLTHAQVASLRPADMVLLDESKGELRLGKGAFPIEIGEKGSRVIGPFEHRGERMDKTKNEVVESIPVELVAEVGRLVLTGKELLDLDPGVVLPLGKPTSATVELTSAGKVVARGQLVDLEGETGIRLTEILI